MSNYNDIYECGVECGNEFRLPEGINLDIIRIPQGRYAMLADDCFADIRSGETKVNRWLENNCIALGDKPFFAVYHKQKEHDWIGMRIYKQLKDDKNG